MDEIRAGQRGLRRPPGLHGILPAHRPVDVPISRPALRRGHFQGIDESRQARVGLQPAAHGRGHVRRTDEYDLRLRCQGLQVPDLPPDRLEVVRDGLVRPEHRDAVAPELEQEQADVLLFVESAQLRGVHRGEEGPAAAAHRHVVHPHAGLAVQQHAVEVRVAGHGQRSALRAVRQREARQDQRLAGLDGEGVPAAADTQVTVQVAGHEGDLVEGAALLPPALHGIIRKHGGRVQADEVAVRSVLADAGAIGRIPEDEIARQRGGCSAADLARGIFAGRHHPGPAPAETRLQAAPDGPGDAVLLDLGVTVMDDAQRCPFRTVQSDEERVEEGRVVIRQVEPGRVRLEERQELVLFGGQHRLAPLLQQLLRRGSLRARAGEHLAEPREAQAQQAPGRESGAEHRQQGDDRKEETRYPAPGHLSFHTLRYSCRAHISSR